MFFKSIILIPNPNLAGGVSNYYNVAKKHFSSSVQYVTFNSKYERGLFKVFFNSLMIIKVLFIISFFFPKRIIVNPSLGKIAFIRDGLFVFWSHLFFIKTIVFWRGWNPKNENIFNNGLFKFLFKLSYSNSGKHLVLNRHIKTKLINLGIKRECVHLTNTIVDDNLINYKSEIAKNDKFKILFLTRIEKYKGIYETIQIYEELSSKGLNIELQIAGSGSELNGIKDIVAQKKYLNIKFLGYVDGEEKIKAFKNADVYLFPSYSEGMPNSVIEAMGCGLPIVCTNVGAIDDFFEEGMGFKHSLPINIDSFVSSILHIYLNQGLRYKISEYNRDYAKKHFIASKSIKNLEMILTT